MGASTTAKLSLARAGLMCAIIGGTAACAGIPAPPDPLALKPPGPEEPRVVEPPPRVEPRTGDATRPRPPHLPLPEPIVEWWPARPIPASVVAFGIRVPAGPPLEDVRLRFAGHDVRTVPSVGGWRGIGALPLDSAGVFELDLAFARAGHSETRRFIFTVPERIYPSTRIRISARPSSDPEVDARIERERIRIRAALLSSEEIWYPEGPFDWPRQPAIETSAFGQRRMFDGRVRSRHLGLDLRARLGNPIRAPAAGRVLLADDFLYQGNAVYLDHGLGLVTAYFHMSSIAVEVGDRVERGDLLGRGGSTGRSTAAHLHWSAYVDGRNIDPATLIGLDLAPTRNAAEAGGR